MKRADPYLNFEGRTLEAFEFYRSVVGGEFLAVLRFRDFGGEGMGIPEEELALIAHVALPLGSNVLMGSDSLPSRGGLTAGNNFSIALEMESGEEARRVFDGLGGGGRVTMPLQRSAWAELYGMLTDRFGVQWMVSYTGGVRFGDSEST